ncbi:MAG: GAF domain-containing protein [Deltaproteobacteria bacterium]|nr:GAF domain-containing protein [Deltaproteobacteria bacterium]
MPSLRNCPATGASPFIPTAYGAAWASRGALTADFARVRRSEELLPCILQASLRLLHGDIAALSLYDPHGHRCRLMGVASADAHWSEWRSLVCRVPPEFAPTPHAVVRSVVVLPGDDPQHPFALLLAQASSAAVYVALFDEDGAAIGTLHVVRRATHPFDERDRSLARSIGDHATSALMAARVV